MEVVFQIYKTSADKSTFFLWTTPWNIMLTLYSHDALPIFHPEFGRYMLEATPGKPWGIGFRELLTVESDMKLR
jgi:hypothetical protein